MGRKHEIAHHHQPAQASTTKCNFQMPSHIIVSQRKHSAHHRRARRTNTFLWPEKSYKALNGNDQMLFRIPSFGSYTSCLEKVSLRAIFFSDSEPLFQKFQRLARNAMAFRKVSSKSYFGCLDSAIIPKKADCWIRIHRCAAHKLRSAKSYLYDHARNVIVSGGVNIYPTEIKGWHPTENW
jgi:hypothetical protein